MISSPFKTKFEEKDINRQIIIPNLTPEFSEIMKVAMGSEGYDVRILPLADERAVELGKYYVHNDICFPAQLNIGELLLALKSGEYDPSRTAIGLSKNCNACRALQYYALARKGLDACGFQEVPIITSGSDVLNIHPGFKLGLKFRLKSMQGMLFVDAINEMRLRLLPYETEPGQTQAVHRKWLTEGMNALAKGFGPVKEALRGAVAEFNKVPADRSHRKPRAGIVGEILVNYHPTGNYGAADYLMKNGMEVHLPPLLEFFRQDAVNFQESARRSLGTNRAMDHLFSALTRAVYGWHVRPIEKILSGFKFYERREDIFEIRDNAATVVDTAFNSGEGWLLPGEIVSMYKKGVRSFVIVQPFGCLPNHITGRGIIKAVKDKYPEAQLLSIDYDPDVSAGNIENRLQMLIVNARTQAAAAV